MDNPHGAVFRKRIVSNPNICPRCFNRVTDVEEKPLPPELKGESWVSSDEVETTDVGEFVYPPRTDDTGREKACKKKLACSECGNVGDFRSVDLGGTRKGSSDGRYQPLTKDELVGLGAAVVERLDEEGVRVNEDAFFTFLREAKSNPSTASKDYDILATSTAFGISHAPLRS